MRLTIAGIDIQVARFSLKIRDPGIIRLVVWNVTKRVVLQRGEPNFEETPAIMIEADVNGPIREHLFVCIPHGEVLDVEDGKVAKWRGTAVSGASGRVVHLFELLDEAT